MAEQVVIPDDGPETGPSPSRPDHAEEKRIALDRIEETLRKLDEMRAKELGQQSNLAKKLAKRKASKQAAPASTWSRGTGYGGSEVEGRSKEAEKYRKMVQASHNNTDESWAAAFHHIAMDIEVSDPDPDQTRTILEASEGLWHVIGVLLTSESMIDASSRSAVYTALFTLSRILSRERSLAPLLLLPLGKLSGDEDGSTHSVNDLLVALSKQAETFRSLSSKARRQGKMAAAEETTVKLCHSIADAAFDVKRACERVRKGSKEGWGAEGKTSEDKKEGDAAEDPYIAELGPLRFEAVDLLEMVDRGQATYHFKGEVGGMVGPGGGGGAGAKPANQKGFGGTFQAAFAGAFAGGGKFGKQPVEAVNPKNRTSRVVSEISTMSSSLPVFPDSSIFVRSDETRPDVIKALITGPQGTPYQNGLFEFDILLPRDYPNMPPKVHFCTTGYGRVRFNPNLYDCGKVCLSLLGTWAGPKWDPANSTLLQVLVSIQALILVDNPLMNEPGYENQAKSLENAKYTRSIRQHTLKTAILDQARNPPGAFKDVIEAHMRLRADHILVQLAQWEGEEPEKLKGVCTEIRSLIGGIKKRAAASAKAKEAGAVVVGVGGSSSSGSSSTGKGHRASGRSGTCAVINLEEDDNAVVDQGKIIDLECDEAPSKRRKVASSGGAGGGGGVGGNKGDGVMIDLTD